MKNILPLLFLVALLTGCEDDYAGYTVEINRADSLLSANPEAAPSVLTTLDSLSHELPYMFPEQRMAFRLTHAQAMNAAGRPFTTDETMNEVKEHYDRYGTDYDRLKTHYLMGCVCRDLHDYPQAMKYLNEALEYADDDIASLRLLTNIHSEMAGIRCRQYLFPEALSEYDVAARTARSVGNEQAAVGAYAAKAAVYAQAGHLDSAALVSDSAIMRWQAMGDSRRAALACGDALEYHVRLGHHNEARACIDAYEAGSSLFHGDTIAPGHERYYYFKGLHYLGLHRADSARVLLHRALAAAADPGSRAAVFQGLFSLYRELGRTDSVAKYAMLCYETNDTISRNIEAANARRQESIYVYGLQQESAAQAARSSASMQRWLFFSFVFLIVMVSLTSYLHRHYEKRIERKMNLMKRRYETEKSLLAQEMDELNTLMEEKEYLVESMGNQLELKNKEVDLEIDRRENSIRELKERISKYERAFNIKDVVESEEDIKRSDVRRDFAYYANHPTKHPSADDWSRLADFAKSHLPKLYMLLHDCNVSEKELRATVLVRLRFKPGEIATIMECTFPEVSLIRNRLLKKVYGIDGKAADYDRRVLMTF